MPLKTPNGAVNDLINRFRNKTQGVLSIPAKAVESDYGYLLEKLAPTNIKISPLGTPTIGHVTLYLEDYDTIATRTEAEYGRGRDVKEFIDDTREDIAWNISQNWKKLKSVFGGEEFYSLVLYDVHFTVTKEDIIVRTSVLGEKGTMNEYVANNGYTITFNGRLTGTTEFGADTITTKKLLALADMRQPINVSNVDLNNVFGITKLIIENPSFTLSDEFTNQYDFTFTAYSAEDKRIVIPSTIETL